MLTKDARAMTAFHDLIAVLPYKPDNAGGIYFPERDLVKYIMFTDIISSMNCQKASIKSLYASEVNFVAIL